MSGQESFGSANVHAGEGAHVSCYTDEAAAPILTVQAGRMTVNISIAGRDSIPAIPAHAVAFARELATQATVFAAECERLHAAQQAAAEHAA